MFELIGRDDANHHTQSDTATAPHIGRPEDYVRALAEIEMSSCERDMLRAHARAPGRKSTGTKLAETVGHVSDYLAAIFTVAEGTQGEGEDWTWEMHDNVVKALESSGMV